jgi:hypothetical protein
MEGVAEEVGEAAAVMVARAAAVRAVLGATAPLVTAV